MAKCEDGEESESVIKIKVDGWCPFFPLLLSLPRFNGQQRQLLLVERKRKKE